MGVGLLAYFIWPPIGRGIQDFGNWIVGAGALGVFIYGSQIEPCCPLAFTTSSTHSSGSSSAPTRCPAEKEVHGDLTRYFEGDPKAGIFMAG
jgi:N-acetylglucosamine PTS system EIICBA or EIICB component